MYNSPTFSPITKSGLLRKTYTSDKVNVGYMKKGEGGISDPGSISMSKTNDGYKTKISPNAKHKNIT